MSRIGNRGRVPFALVGVLLLVSSAAVHASLGGTPAAREPAAEAALEQEHRSFRHFGSPSAGPLATLPPTRSSRQRTAPLDGH